MFIGKLLVMVIFLLTFCAGQTAPDKLLEPDSIGVFFYLDPATQTLKRLPVEEWAWRANDVTVHGSASPFRIAEDKPTFVVKTFKAEDAEGIRLFQFRVKGDSRRHRFGRRTFKTFTPDQGTACNIVKFGESSYKVTPEAPLEAGEYELTTYSGQQQLPMTSRAFTFGLSVSGR